MSDGPPGTSPWVATTHDWTSTLDVAHLAGIRKSPARYAPGGVLHLTLEVLAYAADEATHVPAGRCQVTLHCDGAVTVQDDGRGTDTRMDGHGRPVRKPIMATRDLRFFDAADPPLLPDGYPRRGMSVVAALSEWVVHTNRRSEGAWSQRYVRGVPNSNLCREADDGTTGTTVRFLPSATVSVLGSLRVADLHALVFPPQLTLEIHDERTV